MSDRDDLRNLGSRVFMAAGQPAEPFGLYVFASEAPESELPRHVERSVLDKFFGNSPELLAAEYGPYEAATIFFCVLDHRRRLPAGMLRVVIPSSAGLKSLTDIETVWGHRLDDVIGSTNLPLALDRVWDVTTLAVDDEYRGRATDGLVSLALYQGVCQAALRCNARWLVTILDLVVLNLIQEVTSQPFVRYAGVEPLSYLDSPASLPVYCDLDTYFGRLAVVDPSMHEILAGGRGLEAAVRPAAWERLPARVLRTARLRTA